MSKHEWTSEQWRAVFDDEAGTVAALAGGGDERRVLFGQPHCADEAGTAVADVGRAVAAVNATAGIDDPAQFVQDVRDLLAAWNEGMALGAALEKVQAHIPETA